MTKKIATDSSSVNRTIRSVVEPGLSDQSTMNIGEVVGPPAASAVKGSADESPICDMFEISSVKAPVSDAVMEDHGQIKATLAAGIIVAGKGSGPSIVLSVWATKVPQTTVEIFDAFKPVEADCWRAILERQIRDEDQETISELMRIWSRIYYIDSASRRSQVEHLLRLAVALAVMGESPAFLDKVKPQLVDITIGYAKK